MYVCMMQPLMYEDLMKLMGSKEVETNSTVVHSNDTYHIGVNITMVRV